MPIARLVAACLASVVLTTPVWAQTAPKLPKGDGWIAMVISIVLVVAVLVASFMGAKRGHQD